MHNVHAEAVALQERMSNRPGWRQEERKSNRSGWRVRGHLDGSKNSMLVDHAVLPADKPGADATLVIRNDAGDAACW